MFKVYLAENTTTGKPYVGQTKGTLSHRKTLHYRDAESEAKNCHFHNSIRKHGREVWAWRILDECHTQDQANELESYWIKELDSIEHGYNIRTGGNNSPGPWLGKHLTDEHKKNIGRGCQGKIHHNAEMRKQFSEMKKGSLNPQYGRPLSAATKAKLSEKAKLQWVRQHSQLR